MGVEDETVSVEDETVGVSPSAPRPRTREPLCAPSPVRRETFCAPSPNPNAPTPSSSTPTTHYTTSVETPPHHHLPQPLHHRTIDRATSCTPGLASTGPLRTHLPGQPLSKVSACMGQPLRSAASAPHMASVPHMANRMASVPTFQSRCQLVGGHVGGVSRRSRVAACSLATFVWDGCILVRDYPRQGVLPRARTHVCASNEGMYAGRGGRWGDLILWRGGGRM